jgi:hypothetical protein
MTMTGHPSPFVTRATHATLHVAMAGEANAVETGGRAAKEPSWNGA